MTRSRWQFKVFIGSQRFIAGKYLERSARGRLSQMGVNFIAQVKTVEVQGANGPAVAMMIALDIGDAATAEAFVTVVAERFKLDRMLAPPQTSMLLFTIIGDMSAQAFAAQWKEVEKADLVIHAFMGMMNVADVVQGTKGGQQLGSASLLDP